MSLLIEAQEVKFYENERAWIGRGFSKGLLPTDPGRYCTLDGSVSWKTLEEAEAALLGKGWTYNCIVDNDIDDGGSQDGSQSDQEDGEVKDDGGSINSNVSSSSDVLVDVDVSIDIDSDAGDDIIKESLSQPDDGDLDWLYAFDFTKASIENAKVTRSAATHWVRFRKLVRKKWFDPDQFVSKEIYSKCDHCDSKAIKSLSEKIRDILVYVSLVRSPSSTTPITDAVMLPIKAKLWDLLKDYFDSVSTEDPRVLKGDDAFRRVESLHASLEDFANKERNESKVYSSNVDTFDRRHLDPVWEDRCNIVKSQYLKQDECLALSGLVIRALDSEFQLHCNVPKCGDACRFASDSCPNENCSQIMSKVHLPFHDVVCPFKTIVCPCGDQYLRKSHEVHTTQVCKLRETQCPFIKIGCMKILQAKDVPSHVAEQTTSHLSLALDRMVEYQSVVQKMNNRISDLEKENQKLKESLKSIQDESSNVATTLQGKLIDMEKKMIAMETSTRKQLKAMSLL